MAERWMDRHWDAHLAHAAVWRAVRDGKLTPTPCEVCGAAVTVGHHDDYEKRLEVRWLCDSHHRLWHIEHPIESEVPRPPSRAKPVEERRPNRGKLFHRYLKPRARFLRHEMNWQYRQIAAELKVSVASVHTWCKE